MTRDDDRFASRGVTRRMAGSLPTTPSALANRKTIFRVAADVVHRTERQRFCFTLDGILAKGRAMVVGPDIKQHILGEVVA